MTRIAYISTYPPRRCGLATFTYHLRQYVHAHCPHPTGHVVVVMSSDADNTPADPLHWPLPAEDRPAYRKMAERLNQSDVSVVSLQHEFGIFGGDAGEYILDLVEHLKKPLVTTFHTVFAEPQDPYRRIQQALVDRSDAVIVMSRTGIQYLQDAYGVPREKVFCIPHGTPVPRPEERKFYRRQFGWDGRKVVLTFGLLSRSKGIESILYALPAVVEEVPEVLYVIAGQTHPEVRKKEGESYRRELQAFVEENGLTDHVVMLDQYLEESDLVRLITAADLYVTPYPGMQQITSGTLAYAVGLGRPVLSTPYVYARDLLKGCEELLVPYGDTELWAERLVDLLTEPVLLAMWEKRIAKIGRNMHWPEVGRQHAELFEQVAAKSSMSKSAAAERGQVKEYVSATH
jgi:glycosyltransferase involved in cell wall biosynthesis